MTTQSSRERNTPSSQSAPPPSRRPGEGPPARPRFHVALERVHALRLPLTALALAAVFAASTRSATDADDGLTLAALRGGAERLMTLQADDGSWPSAPGEPGSWLRSAAPARALLAAARAHDDARYLEAATAAGRGLVERIGDEPELATTANLLFLAELARQRDDARLLDLVRATRAQRLGPERAADPRGTARDWLARRNPTRWMDGAWKNYLLWSAGDVAALARACGESDWADEFTLEVAREWAPKHDHQWWALGAGRLARALSLVPGEEARRLEAAQVALIERNEQRPGLPWNDTPYDTYAYTQEAAEVLAALVTTRDSAARERGRRGLRVLATRQSSAGGWGQMISLLDHAVPEGHSDWVPPAEAAVGETAEQDAAVVLALALAHGARATPTGDALQGLPTS